MLVTGHIIIVAHILVGSSRSRTLSRRASLFEALPSSLSQQLSSATRYMAGDKSRQPYRGAQGRFEKVLGLEGTNQMPQMRFHGGGVRTEARSWSTSAGSASGPSRASQVAASLTPVSGSPFNAWESGRAPTDR